MSISPTILTKDGLRKYLLNLLRNLLKMDILLLKDFLKTKAVFQNLRKKENLM